MRVQDATSVPTSTLRRSLPREQWLEVLRRNVRSLRQALSFAGPDLPADRASPGERFCPGAPRLGPDNKGFFQ